MELERPSPETHRLDGNQPVDRPDPVLYTMDGSRKDVINLQELCLHYNIYKQLKFGNVSYTTDGSIPVNTPYLSLPETPTEAVGDLFSSYKMPPVLSF